MNEEPSPDAPAAGSIAHRIGEAGSNIGRRPPGRRWVRLALQAGVAVLIFGFLVYTVASQWTELQDRTDGFTAGWLVPGIAVIAVYYALSALGWDLMLRLLGYEVKPARAQMVWGQSLLARYVPGSVLFVVGRVILAEREGVPRRITLASIVYEVGLAFAAAAALGTYFFVTHPDLAGHPARWAALAVVPAALLAFHPRVFAPAANWALRRIGRHELPVVLPFRGVIAMTVYYLFAWAVLGLGVFFVARSVAPVGFDQIAKVASAQALAFCAGVLTLVAPGGLGVRDGALAWAIKVAFGGSLVVGAAIAIVLRISMTLVEVAFVAVVSALGRRAGLSADREQLDQVRL